MTRPLSDLLAEAREEGARRERTRANLARETARERRAMTFAGAVLQCLFWGGVLLAVGAF